MTTAWRSRLERADAHLGEVEREVDRFLQTEPYRLVGRPERSQFLKMITYKWIGHIDRQPEPRFGDVIGDFIENVRSCLDLIAYALASHAGVPATGTEFPVFWSPDKYEATDRKGKPKYGSGLYKVRTMTVDAQKAIKELQPYYGVDPAEFVRAGPKTVPESARGHPLYLIHELRRINFHRKPHVTGAIAAEVDVGFSELNDVTLITNPASAEIRARAFDHGATVAAMQFIITGPNPIARMVPIPEFEVVFEPDGPAGDQPVVPTLRTLRDHVENVVFARLEPLL